jgi:hypothetical protein
MPASSPAGVEPLTSRTHRKVAMPSRTKEATTPALKAAMELPVSQWTGARGNTIPTRGSPKLSPEW